MDIANFLRGAGSNITEYVSPIQGLVPLLPSSRNLESLLELGTQCWVPSLKILRP